LVWLGITAVLALVFVGCMMVFAASAIFIPTRSVARVTGAPVVQVQLPTPTPRPHVIIVPPDGVDYESAVLINIY
jgi:hypothetical protein